MPDYYKTGTSGKVGDQNYECKEAFHHSKDRQRSLKTIRDQVKITLHDKDHLSLRSSSKPQTGSLNRVWDIRGLRGYYY